MQVVAGVIGAGATTALGLGPGLGWAIGAGLAGAANRPPAPKVGSLAPTEVEYGWAIPRIYGTRRQGTWRLWQSALTAHAVEAEKGGGGTVGYTYTCHMGLLICRRGPSALVRIWRNKELAAVFRTDASEEDIARSLSSRFWSSAIFYDGAADQLPHPTYEAAYAPAAVPAYRGWCTLFIDDAACEGKTPPAIEVEVTTGPEESLGVPVWTLQTRSLGARTRSPGSFASGNIVPVKSPAYFITSDGGYDGSTVWGSYQDALERGKSNAAGAIVSTGEVLVTIDPEPTLVSSTVSDGQVVDHYLVNGVVEVIATEETHVDTYFFDVTYDNPETTFASAAAGDWDDALYSFDGSNDAIVNNNVLCRGSSDEPAVAVVWNLTPSTYGTRMVTSGGAVEYLTGHSSSKYVLRDGVVWFAAASSHGTSEVTLVRCAEGSASPTHSEALSDVASGLACDGTTVYVVIGSTIHTYAADDLTPGGTFAAAHGSLIFCNAAGDLLAYDAERLYQYNGSTWDEILDVTGGLFDQDAMLHPPTYEGGVLYATQQTSAPSGFEAWQGVVALAVTAPTGVELNTILSNYWQACGIPSSMIDLTATDGITVDGYTAEGGGKHVTDELAAAFFFETVNDGAGLKTLLRGQASVATIPYADCGVGVDEAKQEPIELDTDSAAEVPRRISLSAANSEADHEVITESDDRLLGPNVETRSMSLAISMTPERLKGIANTMAADGKTAARQGKVALGLDWIDLELGDVVVLTGRQGETLRVRLVQESFADYVREFDYVLDRAADLQETGYVTAAAREPTLTVQGSPGSALVVPIDGPLLRDADDTPGVYVGADLQGGAQSAVVFQSPDNGTYSSAAEVTTELVRGTLLTSLRGWNGKHQWDAYSTFDVLMAEGGVLTSSTKEAMHANRTINACLIGSPTRGWELGRFVSAPLIAANTHRVTTMLRAMGGTETLAYLHPPGETFILLSDDGSIRSIDAALAQVGTRYWKAVPPGRTLAGTSAVASDFQSIRTKPLSPSYLRCTRDAAGNATFTWSPRTRFLTLWEGGVFPDSEATGTWRVEFFQYGTFSTAVRTKTSSTASVEYTAAEQAADGVSDPARIAVRVRRVSAAGQVGYALEEIR